ncbi:MAG: hypothetical protein KAS39_07260 [Actinomycetia bacterium]|nr:hypothetical protein [Actinomycetes bacterium]
MLLTVLRSLLTTLDLNLNLNLLYCVSRLSSPVYRIKVDCRAHYIPSARGGHSAMTSVNCSPFPFPCVNFLKLKQLIVDIKITGRVIKVKKGNKSHIMLIVDNLQEAKLINNAQRLMFTGLHTLDSITIELLESKGKTTAKEIAMHYSKFAKFEDEKKLMSFVKSWIEVLSDANLLIKKRGKIRDNGLKYYYEFMSAASENAIIMLNKVWELGLIGE